MVFDFLKKDKIIEKDLGLIEDTFGLLCDITAIEDHCINQFLSSNDESYLLELESIRKMRTYYLDLIGKDLKGNTWCIAKHLCRVAKGLQEDCTRFLSMGELEIAKKCANDYGEIYLKFIKLIGGNNVSEKATSSA